MSQMSRIRFDEARAAAQRACWRPLLRLTFPFVVIEAALLWILILSRNSLSLELQDWWRVAIVMGGVLVYRHLFFGAFRVIYERHGLVCIQCNKNFFDGLSGVSISGRCPTCDSQVIHVP